MHTKPREPSEVNPAVSPALQALIQKALEKDRDLRYQSGAEMRADLKRLKRDVASGPSHVITGDSGNTNIASESVRLGAASSPSLRNSSSGAVLIQTAKDHKAGTGIIVFVTLLMIAFGLYGLYQSGSVMMALLLFRT
jgi:hypothetical protein